MADYFKTQTRLLSQIMNPPLQDRDYKYGVLLGALQGLMFRVDEETRKRIESILTLVGELPDKTPEKPPKTP